MRFKRINGKMVRVDENGNELILTSSNKNKPYKSNVLEIPKLPKADKKQGVVAKSSLLATATSGMVMLNTSGINAEAGLFWEMFLQYIYPWFVDLATVYAAIRIAMAFYEEQRGGRDSGNGFGAFITYGKWLLLFHLIPFIVKLIDTVGQRMADSL